METPRLIHDYLPKLHAFGIVHVMNISVLSSETLITPFCTCAGFVGMALFYGLSLNNSFVFSIQNQCQLSNQIISVEKECQDWCVQVKYVFDKHVHLRILQILCRRRSSLWLFLKQSCCFTSSSSVPERSLMLENELVSGDNGARLLHPAQSMLVLLIWKEC